MGGVPTPLLLSSQRRRGGRVTAEAGGGGAATRPVASACCERPRRGSSLAPPGERDALVSMSGLQSTEGVHFCSSKSLGLLHVN